MSILDIDRPGTDAREGVSAPKTVASRRTRGGTSYQHSLSARGIKSSGRARSCSDEDLLTCLDRLGRAARRPLLDEDEEGRSGRRRSRAFGGSGGESRQHPAPSARGEDRVRGPRIDW